MNKLIVDSSNIGKRLDEAIFASNCVTSRTKAAAMIKEGLVTVNGKKEKAHYLVEENDEILYELPAPKKTDLEGQDIPLDIVYEDEDILIINKPAGLVVHPGNGHSDGTVVNALIYRETSLSASSDASRPGIVHRIDKDTSGLLAIAKTDLAFASLAEQLSTHSMHREYVALVKGIILEDDGKIDAPIGRDRKKATKNCIDLNHGKEAVTFFHVEKRFRGSEVSLIRCRLLTGRTHQIRVHMEYIGHPIIGDPLYGEGNRKLYKDGQLLHAYQLTLVHPRTKKEMTFTCDIPEAMKKIISELK